VRLSASRNGRLYLTEMFLVLIFTRDWVKSMGLRSGERGGHATGPLRPIYFPGKWSFRYWRAMRLKCGGAPSCMNHMPTRNVKGMSSSTSGKTSCVSRSKNSRYVGPVNRSGKRTGPIGRSPTIPAQTFI
jgi:hypothetical protein